MAKETLIEQLQRTEQAYVDGLRLLPQELEEQFHKRSMIYRRSKHLEHREIDSTRFNNLEI